MGERLLFICDKYHVWILTTQGVMCHAQVVGGSEVSKYKIGSFFGQQNAGASNHGTLLMKYLDQQCKIGAKKPHQWLERPRQVKISYITLLGAYKMFSSGGSLESNRSDNYCEVINRKSNMAKCVLVYTKDSVVQGFGSELPSHPEVLVSFFF